MSTPREPLMAVWLRERAPGVALMVALAVVLVVIYPEAVDVKLRAAAFVIIVSLGGSFIGVRRYQDRGRAFRREIFRAALDREGGPLPSLTRMDRSRPLLAVASLEGGAFVIIYLVVIGADYEMFVLLVPQVNRGRAPKIVECASISDARARLDELGARVLPQSDFTDRAGVTLFGKDWAD